MAARMTHTLIEDKGNLTSALSEIKSQNLLAVDCEGVNLSRLGELTLLTIATKAEVFIVDIQKLGQAAFDNGLREVLEDNSIEKLMFDCRQDSDSLWHQFKVKLAGVLDIQLLEIMFRRVNSPSPQRTYKSFRRSARIDDVENVYGYRKCIELYLDDDDMIAKKDKGKLMFNYGRQIWKTRPLPKELVQYCVVDVSGLFPLYEKLKQSDSDMPRLRVASERYADMFRGKEDRRFDEYESNALLPLEIIPVTGTLGFPGASTKCTTCDRMFPREEFSGIQLRQGNQKCRVCKKVKLKIDVQINREDNWARDDSGDDYYEETQIDNYYCW
ncbi:piRNA biogenesis protein EXD1-like [Mizuhopecten yessoensis]|uniref:piRNA biogenesis protein EXD1-like n=1 Tax=Mizuhopecten yessoensis TaxID=6573 RepID=UPI000B4592A0|nr:piRNA biogenesis protein EXD1-like [Mizuhopecten yessoensis]